MSDAAIKKKVSKAGRCRLTDGGGNLLHRYAAEVHPRRVNI
jgi:hypothetical protein